MIRVLLVDDHPIVREGLKRILSQRDDIVVAAEIDDGSKVVEAVQTIPCDLVLLDLAMPGMSGLEVLTALQDVPGSPPVLVLSIYGEAQYAVRTICNGASGYLTKESAPDTLLQAIDRVYQGGRYISERVAERLADIVEGEAAREPHERLSNREFQIFELIGKGLAVTEIARRLNLSVKTVSTYRGRVLQKLQLSSNAELIRYALTQGFVE